MLSVEGGQCGEGCPQRGGGGCSFFCSLVLGAPPWGRSYQGWAGAGERSVVFRIDHEQGNRLFPGSGSAEWVL